MNNKIRKFIHDASSPVSALDGAVTLITEDKAYDPTLIKAMNLAIENLKKLLKKLDKDFPKEKGFK